MSLTRQDTNKYRKTSEPTELTPELAETLLDGAYRNRPVSKPLVTRYARDISRGQFITSNLEVMETDAGARLFGGQHRCHAVMEAGKAIEVRILVLSESEALAGWAFEDAGRSQTFGDFLSKNNVPQATIVGGILNGLYGSVYSTEAPKIRHSDTASRGDLVLLYDKFGNSKLMSAAVNAGRRASIPKVATATVLGTGYLMVALMHGQEVADDFFSRLATGLDADGQPCELGDPARIVREQFNTYQKKLAKGEGFSANKTWAILTNALNDFINGDDGPGNGNYYFRDSRAKSNSTAGKKAAMTFPVITGVGSYDWGMPL